MRFISGSAMMAAILFLTSCATAPVPLVADAQGAAADRLYTNSTYRWSVSYPSSWTIDDKNPAAVKILSSEGNALCGIYSSVVRFKTVDELTDYLLAQNEQSLKRKGLLLLISARRQISLPNGIIGNDVTVLIVPGGRSRRILVLRDGQAFVMDCETYATNWETTEPFFEQIISSFTLGK